MDYVDLALKHQLHITNYEAPETKCQLWINNNKVRSVKQQLESENYKAPNIKCQLINTNYEVVTING